MVKVSNTVKRLRARIKELESQQELAKKIVSNVNVRDVTHGVGFVSMAWIIKEGMFDPLGQLLDALGILKAPSAEEAPLSSWLAETTGWDFPIVSRVDALTKKIKDLPTDIGQKLGEDAFDNYKRDLEEFFRINQREATDEEKVAIAEPRVNQWEWRQEIALWAFGFAGAWAFGKFLSETTWSEVVEAIPIVQ